MRLRIGQFIRMVLALAGLLYLSSCGNIGGTFGPSEPQKQVRSFSFDGIKSIREGVTEGLDPSTLNQEVLSVSSNARILLRFESLRDSRGNVLTKEDDVWIRVTLKNPAQMDRALLDLEMCPLRRGDWMLAATWKFAHPFAPSGRWKTSGGDFDLEDCSSGTRDMKVDPDTGKKPDEGAIYFNVTRWFRDYVVGRNVNFGHVLISLGAEQRVFGDASGAYSPRILWTEQVKDPK